MENIGKAAADAYLDMFPQDLLDSNKRVRPIDVRIIEHDGFIDYEIEFVELSDEYDSDSVIDTGHDNQEGSDKLQTDSINVEVTTQKIATTVPVSTTTGVTAVTFVDLLRRARRKYRQNVSQEEQKNRARTFQPGTSPFFLETTESSFESEVSFSGSRNTESITPASVRTEDTKPVFQRRNRIRNENVGTPRNMDKKRKRVSQQDVGDATSTKTLILAQRLTKTGILTELKPAWITESTTSIHLSTKEENELEDTNLNNGVKNMEDAEIMTTTPIHDILSFTSMPSYQEFPRSSPDNVKPNGDKLLQVDDSLLERQTESISGIKMTPKPGLDFLQTTEKTTTLSLIEELKRQLITISYDLSEDQSAHEDKPPTTTLAPGSDHSMLDTMYQLEDLQISESRSVADLYSEEETLTEKSTASEQIVPSEWPDFTEETTTHHADDALTSTIFDSVEGITELPDAIQPFTQFVSNTDYETMQTETAEITTETQYSLPERSPKRINSKGVLSQIIEDSTDVEGLEASQTVLPDEVIKDSYQEANPGQYHEMNPGQYHEVNPGQYHESSPGQYHETHPGQYDEKHPGQDLGVDNVTVDFDHTDESRTYNVKASAGDFILGEVGRIDINSGQTLEGVRYTAVEGEVDQARIADILERYFGARAS
eukprot:GFUD01008691.1.p1 GENE.GFUD01008691.1~~GFUD01008691.1.p1  ORF type:complete len:754 (-),score=195.97 GFUD01008691.1:42-2009(-)